MQLDKRALLLVASVSIASLAVCGLARAFPLPLEIHQNHGSLVVTERLRDLGSKPRGFRQVICFKIGNQGSRRLVLNERDQQCDCGGRAVRTIILAPGQTTQIQVPFDTQTATGLVESSISFTTSDPQQPILDFKVRAYVGTDDQKSY